MEVYFYKADCGDAARLRYLGDDGKFHNIFIDAGYRKTFRKIIKSQIQEIEANDESLDLWIISHIHDDHIGGVEQYIKQIRSGELKDIVRQWWYNAPRKANNQYWTPQVSSPISIRQGDLVAAYLAETQNLPKEDIVTRKHPVSINGLKIHLLSPTIDKLNNLRIKYNDKLQLEKIEGAAVSSAAASVKSDYHIKLEEFDLSKWKEDTSVENGSSISMFTEYQNKRILWLADAHPSDVVDSLQSLGYSNDNKFKCDFVKVAHHGSRGNNSTGLYGLIECSNYVFSANGANRHKLPTKESIAIILRNQYRDICKTYHLYFLDQNKTLERIFENESDDIFSNLNFQVHFLDHQHFLKFGT